MSIHLLYGFDNVLSDDERELGRVAVSETGAYVSIRVDGLAYEIVRLGRHGWHFSLMEASGARALCEFHPFRLREGGKLLGSAVPVRLKHRVWSGNWAISGLGPALVTARHPQARRLRKRFAAEGPLEGLVRVEDVVAKLDLSSEAPLPQTRETIPMLVFACWLIVQWEASSIPGEGGATLIGAGG